MKFERTLVYPPFVLEAVLGARLSYGSGAASDSRWFEDGQELEIGPRDTALCKKLLVAGHGHDKFLRTIPVSVVITAPLMWWVELDTYKVGTVRQSESLMHRLARFGEFRPEDFDEDPDDPRFVRYLSELNDLVTKWIEAKGRRNSGDEQWLAWQKEIRRSYLYASHWQANYGVLRNIYFQRLHHRLGVYWKPFIAWVEQLPESWLITYTKEA